MSDPTVQALIERIERVERELAELRASLNIQIEDEPDTAVAEKEPGRSAVLESAPVEPTAATQPAPLPPIELPPIPTAKPKGATGFILPEHMRSWEYWLNKIGIGLVLFAVVFLFKYSVEQGWLNPAIRIGFALALGTALLAIGARLYEKRRHFGLVLLGGGLATYYITGFAAFQMFELISHPTAFGFMVLVTALAFFVSLRQNEAVLSVVATLGGLATPFLLYTGVSNLPGLTVYLSIMIVGTSGVYFYKGWRSVLWITVAGIWLVYFLAVGEVRQIDVLIPQLGIVFAFLAFWLVPVFREVLWRQYPERWVRATMGIADKSISKTGQEALDKHVHALAISSPLIALSLSMTVWSYKCTFDTWGWICFGGAAAYFAVAYLLRGRAGLSSLSYTHSLVGLLLLTIGLCFLLDGSVLYVALAAEAAVLYLIAGRLMDRGVRIFAHMIYGIVGLWLVFRLSEGASGNMAILNTNSLSDIFVILTLLLITILTTYTKEKTIYSIAAHIAILCLLLRELTPLQNGQAYASIAWGVYGTALLIAGLRRNLKEIRLAGLLTLMALVIKLFLVDLADLETIWRVLLFLGFGGLFLLLSYFFQSMWKDDQKPLEE